MFSAERQRQAPVGRPVFILRLDRHLGTGAVDFIARDNSGVYVLFAL
jgi:hypothetical protein